MRRISSKLNGDMGGGGDGSGGDRIRFPERIKGISGGGNDPVGDEENSLQKEKGNGTAGKISKVLKESASFEFIKRYRKIRNNSYTEFADCYTQQFQTSKGNFEVRD